MHSKKSSKILVLLAVILLASLAGNVWSYQRMRMYKENPEARAEQEIQELLGEVSKLMVLPEGEEPTIATVTDPEKLKDQPFFAQAVVGDRVLIYTNAKKAILYRPSEHKIVELAPINIGEPAPAAQ